MKKWPFAVLAAISAVSLAQPGDQLPPGHPPIGEQGSGSSPAAASQASPPAGDVGLPAGHPPMRDGAAPPTADELLKRLDAQPDLKTREKTFEVATSLGKLYYSSARYLDAAVYLGQAWTKTESARKLYVQQRKKVGATAASGCGAGQEMQALAGEMEKRAAAGDAKGAVACGVIAMGQALEVGEMRANALALSGDLKGAVSGYEQVLDVDASREGSLYGHVAALLESRRDDISALKMASVDLGSLIAVAEPSPRTDFLKRLSTRVDQAIAAGGMSKLVAREETERKAKGPPKMPPFVAGMMGGAPSSSASSAPSQGPTQEQIRNMEEAARNMPRTPEVEQGFAKLVEEAEVHLAGGRYQEALDAYKRVVPFQPENSRARAGMAWAMVQLNRQPMADRVWGVAVSGDPSSLEKLGDTLRQKGDEKGARGLWTKLKDSAPDYAAKSGLAKKLN